jgi:hypothetical protein
MDNLIPNPANPDDRTPFQRGAAQGDAPGGGRANEQKNWVIDTGAQISCISAANAANFATTPVAGGAAGVNGPPLVIVTGVTMLFQVIDRNGRPKNVSCNLPVAITPTDDIIGTDQLSDQHAQLDWCADTRTGRLYERPIG